MPVNIRFNLDSEVGGIVLVLVVVLVLDLWDFGAEKTARSFGNFLFHHFGREMCRILEDEHEQEHDFSASAFKFSRPLAPILPSERPCFDRIFALDRRSPPENRP